MEAKKLTGDLDKNLFSDKYFKKAYVFYAFWLVLSPIVETILGCFGLKVIVMIQTIFISIIFILTKFFELIFNFRNINLKNKTIIDLLLVVLFVCILISTIVTKTFNLNFLFVICYFSCIYLFLNIDKKFFKLIAIVFIIEMILNSLLGLIDLNNKFIPGFVSREYVMSMQFYNPNWSAAIVIIAEILTLMFICYAQKIWQKVLLFFGFIIMTIGLFVGGSYAPETALFLCEFALLIYLWIKNKKCPWWILSAFLLTIFTSFAVWFIPAFRAVTTAQANYFYESLAVIDKKLGTNLVKNVSTFFDKLFGWGVFSEVPGSDGWDRDDFKAQAYSAIFTSVKTFIFGNGCSFIDKIRVHNCYLVVWMEFGIFAILVYIAILVMFLIRFIKVKKSDSIVFLFSCFVMLLFESLFCCVEPFFYPFILAYFTIVYKVLYNAELKSKKSLDANRKIEGKGVTEK